MKKLLLIEDDIFLIKVYKTLFEKEGFAVLTLSSGIRALETVLNESPDLILLDLMMPEKDGFETLEDLKSNEQTKGVPVFVLTVLRGDEDIKRVRDLGAEEYIIKSETSFEDVIGFVKTKLNL